MKKQLDSGKSTLLYIILEPSIASIGPSYISLLIKISNLL